MRNRITLVVIMALLGGSLSGCGEDKAAIRAKRKAAFVAEHGASLKLKAASLKKIRDHARRQGPLSGLAKTGVAQLSFAKAIRGGNASVLQLETLTGQKPKLILSTDRGHWRKELGRFTEGKRTSYSLRDAAAIGHVAVVRTHSYTAPSRKVGSITKFVPGAIGGDVLLYELESGSYKGGTTWKATSGMKVKTGIKQPESGLRSDLMRQAMKAVNAGLKELAAEVKTRK
ncbi:MAG: hypothetical protein KC502_19950 [Myxococcales bacterium]|nr:hypothetical protein [Myxococcales bacterium]